MTFKEELTEAINAKLAEEEQSFEEFASDYVERPLLLDEILANMSELGIIELPEDTAITYFSNKLNKAIVLTYCFNLYHYDDSLEDLVEALYEYNKEGLNLEASITINK